MVTDSKKALVAKLTDSEKALVAELRMTSKWLTSCDLVFCQNYFKFCTIPPFVSLLRFETFFYGNECFYLLSIYLTH